MLPENAKGRSEYQANNLAIRYSLTNKATHYGSITMNVST